jgi:hypothetical protein
VTQEDHQPIKGAPCKDGENNLPQARAETGAIPNRVHQGLRGTTLYQPSLTALTLSTLLMNTFLFPTYHKNMGSLCQ